MTEELLPLADFARSLVVSCGARLEERRRGLSPAMREKGSYRDIVTDHDLWVQEYLLSRLLARWPDHGVLGEEGARRQGTSPWTWVLDPIDGTTNYYQAGRGCAISLGLLYRGEPVWGLVLDISSGKAREGSIPYGPGRSGSLAPHQAMLHLGVRTMESLTALGGNAYRFARQFQGVRYFGCASLELCSVAEERGGVYVNSHLKLWDFAAAWAILRSQGCSIAAAPMEGEDWFVCAATSRELYQACLTLLPPSIRTKLEKTGGILSYAEH